MAGLDVQHDVSSMRMIDKSRHQTPLQWLLICALLSCLLPHVASAAYPPLPESAYSARPVCGQPGPGRLGCLAFTLSPRTAAAKARTHPLGVTLARPTDGNAQTAAYGLRPQDLHDSYELPLGSLTPQTVGIVDAYDDPTIEADLQVYDETFGLPECTSSNGCFLKLNQDDGAHPLPEANDDWASEIALDTETVHAVCQNCRIVLVEASSNSVGDFEAAEEAAIAAGADEISNSYGGADYYYGNAYDHPGIVITASTGDYGYDNWTNDTYGTGANYPAAFAGVVSVGGTELSVSGGSWASETAWDLGGSGCNVADPALAWQTSLSNWADVGCGAKRASADISADADPYTGVAIYDSTPYSGYNPGWLTMGGTSLASPIIASAFALAGGSHGVEYPAQTLYSSLGTSALHDVTSGSNWGCATGSCSTAEVEANCGHEAICNAGIGYDGPTGVGTLRGISALEPDGPGTPPPTVSSVAPASGTTRGGTLVTIEGTGLEDPLYVRFGEAHAVIVSSSEESVTVETPAHVPDLVDITVTDRLGIRSATSSADRYEYTVPMPNIASIAPDEGPTSGGATVTLKGTNLGEVEYVAFGGSYASVLDSEDGELTVLTPSHESGAVELSVVGPYGVIGQVSPRVGYTFVAPPLPPKAVLTISSSGSGEGSISVSAPPSVSSCRGNCTSTFSPGTKVWLYAYPDSGSTFQGWSGGGCAGSGICELLLDEDTTVSAIFAKIATITPPPQIPLSGTTTLPGSASSEERSDGGSTRDDNSESALLQRCLIAARQVFAGSLRRAGKSGAGRRAATEHARRLKTRRSMACHRRFAAETRSGSR
jgi:IPT/TIG domain/Divergent InlB B-repeat domain/Subtilase family